MKLDYIEGIQIRLCDNWFNYIPINKEKPINYLEIGTLHGANLLSVADYYGKHIDSKLYCIDPWDDYEDYNEYKELQNDHFNIFLKNLNNHPDKDKITYYKNYSHKILPTLEDDYFDIIYIDGNHDYDVALADYKICRDSLADGGLLVMDDSSLYTDFKPPGFSFAGHPGPSRVVQELAMKELIFLGGVGHNNVFIKPSNEN
jgi:predicted O-methyltransferase YrrM